MQHASRSISRMPDTRRLAYPEDTVDYHLFVDSKTQQTEDEGILIQSGIISKANGSSYLEYKNSKVVVACYGPKDIQRREDFTLDGFLKVDLNFCHFASRTKRTLPGELKDKEKALSTIVNESLSSVIQLKRYPKSQIDICIQILEEGDSEYVTLATILTACGVAIGDAGLEMFGLVVAAANEKTFVALMPELNQVTGLITEEENVKPIILEAKAIYPHVHQHFVN